MNNFIELRELLKIKNGKDYKSLGSGNIPVYGTGGIMTYVDKYLYDGESILLPRKGTLSNICYINEAFWSVDTMYWTIIDKNKIYPKYLFCYLSLLDLSSRDSGSALPSMTFESYYSIPIKIIDYKIQKKIGDSYFAITNKIENNNSINIELESMAKTIYDYWFLQFEFPNEEGKPYKSSGGKMIWNEELKKEIPEGWKTKLLKEVVSKEKNAIVDGPFGTQMKIEEYVSEGIPIYEMEQLEGDFIVKDNNHFISDKKFIEVQRSSVKNGDIIMSKTGTLGKLGIVRSKFEKGIIVSRLMKISTNEDIIGKYALLMILQELTDNNYWLNVSNGSTMPILNNKIISEVKIIMPNNCLYKKYESLVSNYYEMIYNNQIENKELTSLKDFLLPMLMNRQVGFKD